MQAEREFLERIRLNRRRCILEYYQLDGVKWMHKREQMAFEAGGIVADEMGLGKTVMALATIYASRSSLPTLVIAPVAVVEQWASESLKFVGIDALIMSVNSLRRTFEDEEIVDGEKIISTRPNPAYISLEEIASYDLVIAPHSCFNASSIDYEDHALLKANFGRFIVDEAHVIKNTEAIITRNVARVKAPIRWCMTGTPVVTKQEDLSALLAFVTGGNGAVVHEIMAEPTRRAATYLRRTKEDIGARVARLQCVRLNLKLQMIEFSDIERTMYAASYRYLQWLLANSEPREKRKWLLKGITQLRRLASRCSGKTLALVDAFRRHPPGTRSLIFCNYTDEIESVTAALRASGTVDVVMPYVGKMTSKMRNQAVKSFMERRTSMSKALVIQIQAGSVGLNLQAASQVYIMSPHWNATTEQQAIARAHRTGTTHVVEVTRFVVKDTVEEYMHNLQQEKLIIAATTLVDERLTTSLNADESIGGTVTWLGKIFDSHIFDEDPAPNGGADSDSDSDDMDADV